MPALPWTTVHPPDPDRTAPLVAMASRLPLERYSAVPRFLRGTLAIRRQLATSPGLVGYALRADLLRKTFWTYSVWTDEQSVRTFAAADPHRSVVRSIRPAMGRAAFRFLTVRAGEERMSWEEIERALDGVVEPEASQRDGG